MAPTEAQISQGIELLDQIASSFSNVSAALNKVKDRVQSKELDTNKGISLLELKNHANLSYLSNVTYVVLRKLSGLPMEGSPCVKNLIDLRVLLERVRPIQDKMKYQIEKYLKVDLTNESDNTNKANIKSNLDNIESSSEDEATKATSKEIKDSGGKLYRIPRITQTAYPGDEDKVDARKTRERRRLLQSSMVTDALSEHVDDPEVVHNSNLIRKKALEKQKMIDKYEEENFTRLTLSKKDKHILSALTTTGNLSQELLSFRSLDVEGGGGQKSNKRKKTSKNQKGGKNFKRKKR